MPAQHRGARNRHIPSIPAVVQPNPPPPHSLSPWQHFLCGAGWLEELPWAPSLGEGTFFSGKMPITHPSPFLRQAQY